MHIKPRLRLTASENKDLQQVRSQIRSKSQVGYQVMNQEKDHRKENYLCLRNRDPK